MLTKETLVTQLLVPDNASRRAFEAAAARVKELRLPLATNPALTSSTVVTMFKRPALDLALALVSRPLESEAVEAVIKSEVRERVLLRMIEHTTLDTDQLALLASKKTTKAKLAAKLLEQAQDPGLQRELALRAGETALLGWLCTSGVKESVARDLMEGFSSWAPKRAFKERARLLVEVLERFPGLVDVFVAPGQDVSAATAASSSRFLTDPVLQRRAAGLETPFGPVELEDRRWALMALVNNPVVGSAVLEEFIERYPATEAARAAATRQSKGRGVVTSSYEEVSDPELLKWLLGRSLPSDFKPAGRPHDLAALAANPHLERGARRRVAVALSYPGAADSLGDRFDAAFDALVGFDPELEDLRPEVPVYGGEPVAHAPALDFSLFPIVESSLERAAQSEVSTMTYWHDAMWVHVGHLTSEAFGTDEAAYENFINLAEEFEGTLEDLLAVAAVV